MAGKCLVICCIMLAALVMVGESCPSWSDDTGTNKQRWPEVVGMTGKEAYDVIKGDNPSLTVEIVPYGYAVTADYRTDRVRIYLDTEGIVDQIPMIG